jgi:hypothetical protein
MHVVCVYRCVFVQTVKTFDKHRISATGSHKAIHFKCMLHAFFVFLGVEK